MTEDCMTEIQDTNLCTVTTGPVELGHQVQMVRSCLYTNIQIFFCFNLGIVRFATRLMQHLNQSKIFINELSCVRDLFLSFAFDTYLVQPDNNKENIAV